MTEQTRKLYVFSHNRYASLDWALQNGLQSRQIVHIFEMSQIEGRTGFDFIELPSAAQRNDYGRMRADIKTRQPREIKTTEQLEEWKRLQRPAFAQ